jgi:hypothetical protein
MNRINNTTEGAARRTWLTSGLANEESKWSLPGGRGLQPKNNRRGKPLAAWLATCAFLFSPCIPIHGGWLKADVDFSNYNVPLYQQIVNRIKAKGAPRLGKGKIHGTATLLFLLLTRTKGMTRNFHTRSSR